MYPGLTKEVTMRVVSGLFVLLETRHVDAPARYRPDGEEAVLTANILVDGAKALFLELRERGVAFAQTLKEQPWGATDFHVRDPDGNLLCFASVPAASATPMRIDP
jgi:uncharacterized glyoxalase superfamily protein PhnB